MIVEQAARIEAKVAADGAVGPVCRSGHRPRGLGHGAVAVPDGLVFRELLQRDPGTDPRAVGLFADLGQFADVRVRLLVVYRKGLIPPFRCASSWTRTRPATSLRQAA